MKDVTLKNNGVTVPIKIEDVRSIEFFPEEELDEAFSGALGEASISEIRGRDLTRPDLKTLSL